MKRPVPGKLFGKVGVTIDDPQFQHDYPHLFEMIKATSYDDGTMRRTATLLIFVEDGCLKLVINDRDVNRSAFIDAPTVDGLFAEAEAQLSEDRVDWKVKQQYNPSGNKPTY